MVAGQEVTVTACISTSPAALPLTLGLLCEINPFFLALGVATALAHEATAIWDVRAAVDGGREIRPAEQHIHSFLESMPFMAMSALLCLHFDQVHRARKRGFADRDAWRLRPRGRRLPAGYLAAILGSVAFLIAAPYGEELLRCARTSGQLGG